MTQYLAPSYSYNVFGEKVDMQKNDVGVVFKICIGLQRVVVKYEQAAGGFSSSRLFNEAEQWWMKSEVCEDGRERLKAAGMFIFSMNGVVVCWLCMNGCRPECC